MHVTDFNGEGDWSDEAIRSRYARYAGKYGITPRDLASTVYAHGDRRWVYPVMNEIIKGIEAGDAACATIGVEFIELDRGFPFGKVLKSNTARALRRTTLAPELKQRVIRRVFGMLQRGYIPREYREYAKLAKRVGYRVGELPNVDQTNLYIARYYRYFAAAAT